MRKTILTLLAALLAACAASAGEIVIVPRPISAVKGSGEFVGKGRVTIAVDKKAPELTAVAELFTTMVGHQTDVDFDVKTSAWKKGAVNLSLDPALETEEYRLSVKPSGVTIAAGSPQGVLHGLQSLRQLIAANAAAHGSFAIPAVEIKDKPFFKYRGGMLDVARHYFPLEEIKKYIDILSMHKINRFHWHLVDDQGWRIEIKKYPELTRVGSVRKETLVGHLRVSKEYDGTPYGGFYTQDEVREIVKYAADRFITVIPEIEMPGHGLGPLAAYPWLGCTGGPYEVWTRWGISDDIYCAGKETTFEFLENVLSELLDIFPSQYIHIGGDEAPKMRWKECPLCQKRMKDNGLADETELQSYFMNRIEKWLEGHGRKVIGWDEILGSGISKTATIMWWRGNKTELGSKAAKLGHDVIFAPNTHCYLDNHQTLDPVANKEPIAQDSYRNPTKGTTIRKLYGLDPYADLTPDERRYILGVQANLWAEYIATGDHVQFMILPRIAALSEVGWSYDRKDFDNFRTRMQYMRKLYDTEKYNYAPYFFQGIE